MMSREICPRCLATPHSPRHHVFLRPRTTGPARTTGRRACSRRVVNGPAQPMIESVVTPTAGKAIDQTHWLHAGYHLVPARPVRGTPRELARRRKGRPRRSQRQPGRTCPELRRRTGPPPIGRLRRRILVGGPHFAANWGNKEVTRAGRNGLGVNWRLKRR